MCFVNMVRVLEVTLLGEELSEKFKSAIEDIKNNFSDLGINLFRAPHSFSYSVPSPMVIVRQDGKILRREYGNNGLGLIYEQN